MHISKSELKSILALQSSHGRKKQSAFLVEGPKLVEELLESKMHIKHLLATQEWMNSNPQLSDSAIIMKPSDLDRYSLFSKANQVIAVVHYPKKVIMQLDLTKHILVLDTIQDPGNMGTILRTADWFGINQVICSPETADIFNPKVVQASMGSIFRVQVQYTDLYKTIHANPQLPVYGTLLKGTPLKEIQFKDHGFIIIGNESKGISKPLKKLINQAVYIPRFRDSKTESLNASVACGILLSQLQK